MGGELSSFVFNNSGYQAKSNSCSCGLFVQLFLDGWNERFNKKVNIVFVLVKNFEECWHVLIRLLNGLLFDGGIGVHDQGKYKDNFDIEDMAIYNLELLDKRSYGLNRVYPRYCPNFSKEIVKYFICNYLKQIDYDDL